jgi:hypothetical protein
MASGYPAALDTLTTNKQDDTDSKSGSDLGTSTTTGDHAQHHNDVADAVNKIEAELGTAPKGLYAANVRERFEISSYKNQSCKAATVANVAGAYANGTAGVGATIAAGGTTLTVDTIVMANGDRLLVKNQTTPANNGIYTVSGIGTAVVLTRSIDADTSAKIADCKLLIDQGQINSDTEWYQASTAPTMGTTALYFRRTQPIYGHGNPRSPWTPGQGAGVAPVIMETLPRPLVTGVVALATGATQYLVGGIVAPAGRTVTNINMLFSTANAWTVSWFGLARVSDRQLMAVTAQATTAPVVSTVYTRAFSSAWTPIEDTPVWAIISESATTANSIYCGPSGSTAGNLVAPAVSATNGVVPTTTPSTTGTIMTAPTTGVANIPYIWLT